MSRLTESVVEQAALAWFGSLGYTVKSGPAIAPDGSIPKRGSYTDVILHDPLRPTLVQLNPTREARIRGYSRMVGGAQVRVLEFEDPERNDWLVVKQFTVASP